ncbi:MAG: hypothetical protein M1830_008633 [Pleopsidium flavum]|nr:MAG: hypothetical protein M1830_008633 [Pleopsidium flavum]
MQLSYPAPFGAENNPHRTDPVDPYLQYPFNCCGRKTPFPCGGHLDKLGTPQGASVASWPAGSVQNFSLTGIGNHFGGSCQVGFSVDHGKTFQVATSYEGNCPHRNGGEAASGQKFDFTVPADIPTGDVVFAWTWYNREQEFNMNCAAVTVTPTNSSPPPAAGSSASKSLPSAAPYIYTSNGCTCTCDKPQSARALLQRKSAEMFIPAELAVVEKRQSDGYSKGVSMPYQQRPGFLIADTGNGCETPHTTAEVKYPNPGPDVVVGDGAYPLELPTPKDKCGY